MISARKHPVQSVFNALGSLALWFSLINPHMTMAGNVTDSAAPDIAATTLAEADATDGIVFSGSGDSHEQTVYFTTPRALNVNAGQLRLYYTAAPTVLNDSLLRIDINGMPRYAERIKNSGNRVSLAIPLQKADFSNAQALRVTVKAAILVSDDRCHDLRLTPNFLYIHPDSQLELQLDTSATSFRAGWELLPKKVTVSLPQTMNAEAFQNALLLTRQLYRDGKEVTFTRLPQWGQIVLAPKAELQALIAATYPAKAKDSAQAYFRGDENLAYLKLPDRRVLVISDDLTKLPAAASGGQWGNLLASNPYHVKQNALTNDSLISRGRQEISLTRLGLNLQPMNIGEQGSWSLDTTSLPANKRLEMLNLNVVSAPSEHKMPVMLYVYLNGVLQHAAALNNNGAPNHISAPLAANDQRPGSNQLRLVVQRTLDAGNCKGAVTGQPVQISGDSTLIVDDFNVTPRQFVELRPYFAGGLGLYLPQSVLDQADQHLFLLARLIEDNRYPVDPNNIHFFPNNESPQVNAPFLIYGHAELAAFKPAVRFDKGEITVTGSDQQPLLNIDHLDNITVAQIVDYKGQHGLWFRPAVPSQLPSQTSLVLTKDDVAFLDQKGIVLTLNHRHSDLAFVEYGQKRRWLGGLGIYRFWLLGLAWILVTVAVVMLYRKVRQHRAITEAVDRQRHSE